ncbi:hypothetical protein WA026_001652 [Henosepilachna vigintioctopunctata]|uniref:lysozyme n=1 Tax=Henosepilachna vigintioctopunctata TaxID=420089 RepID=A0AAW1URT3_9CUCU
MFLLFVNCFLFFATLSVEGYVGLRDRERVPCLECICEATTACNDIFVCAEKNINVEYWSFAGENIAGGEKNRKSDSNSNYRDCMKDRICILNTMFDYTNKVVKTLKDINCDGIISCADLFGAHKFGLNAKKPGSTFSIGVSKRFDRCEYHGIINVTNNWFPNTC